jgi:heme/copper-type cytochrome/quinol oxidase subunit 4
VWQQAVAIAAAVVLTIMPFVTAVYLNRRLGPSRRAPRLSPA